MANRFWVGGAGTWNNTLTTNWASFSGGPGGASFPTVADDVYFDVNSGTGLITLGTSVNVRNFNVEDTDSGLYISGSSNITISGDMDVYSNPNGFVIIGGVTLIFNSIFGQNITFGRIWASGGHSLTFNGSGSWTLNDNWGIIGVNSTTVRLTTGTLYTNGQTINCNSLICTGTNTRTLDMTNSTFNVYNAWTVSGANHIITNVDNNTINFGVDRGAFDTFSGNSRTYGTFNLPFGISTSLAIGNGNTFRNFTYTGENTASVTNNLTFGANTTITNTLTLVPPKAPGKLITIGSTNYLTRANIIYTGTGVCNFGNAYLRGLNVISSYPVNSYSCVVSGSNSGIPLGIKSIDGDILTSNTLPWTVPSNWSNTSNRFYLVGGGGGSASTINGGGGGGGGGFCQIDNLSLSPGNTINCWVGVIGFASASSAPGGNGGNTSILSYIAYGGQGGLFQSSGGAGGGASGGTLNYTGGNGGNWGAIGFPGGGGGAAGPNGNGGNGGDGSGSTFGSGGGADGGTSASGTTPGQGSTQSLYAFGSGSQGGVSEKRDASTSFFNIGISNLIGSTGGNARSSPSGGQNLVKPGGQGGGGSSGSSGLMAIFWNLKSNTNSQQFFSHF